MQAKRRRIKLGGLDEARRRIPKGDVMRKIQLCLALMAATSAVLAQDRGLTAPATALGGAFWQARFERDSNAMPQTSMAMPSFGAQTLRMFGDYQFSSLRLGDTGGLRLTGGLLINLRTGLSIGSSADNATALPYAGIGYSSGSNRGEWGFSADLGLAAPGLASWRLDRLISGGGLTVDGGIRLQPMVRLGMNVAF